jgi:hypothetical protein
MKKEIILNSPKIELLNSEGPILVAYKAPDNKFYIFDQWKSFVAVFDVDLMTDFINGNESILDSKGRNWSYNDVPDSMKPNVEKLREFTYE